MAKEEGANDPKTGSLNDFFRADIPFIVRGIRFEAIFVFKGSDVMLGLDSRVCM